MSLFNLVDQSCVRHVRYGVYSQSSAMEEQSEALAVTISSKRMTTEINICCALRAVSSYLCQSHNSLSMKQGDTQTAFVSIKNI